MNLALVTVLFAALGAGQTPATAPAAAPKSVDIPDGTPVTFHLYGRDIEFLNADRAKNPREFYTMVQVDQDVVVNGVVVVPRGALGEVKVTKAIKGAIPGRGFLGVGTGVVGFELVANFVFSTASTELQFQDTPLKIDVRHKNGVITSAGVMPLGEAVFTVGLKHASMTLPVE